MEKDNELQIENGSYTRIVNRVMDELVKAPLLGAEFRVCLFIIRKTYGFNKLQDKISLTQFQEGLKMGRPTVIKALKNLEILNLVLITRGAINTYKFNKYYTKWKVVKASLLVKTPIPRVTGKGGLTRIVKTPLPKLVKTPLHTKDKRNSKDNITVNATNVADVFKKVKKAIKKSSKNYEDPKPVSLNEFVEKMRESPQRHMQILGEYADEIKASYTTKGQWLRFIDRHVRSARALVGYSEDQIEKAFEKLKKSIRSDQNPKGYITKWTLATLEKYLD